jgi:hypothetical protein
MKTRHFPVILFLIFNLFGLGFLPPSEFTHHTPTTESVENQDLPEIIQVSKEYLPASLSPALLASKSRPQIPSWQGSLFIRLLQRTHLATDQFLLEAFLPPSTILNLVSTIILRC